MKNSKNILLVLCVIFPLVVFAAGSKKIILNEFLTSNSTGIKDADGDYSDWIELYNPGSTSINLLGWSLTDSYSNLAKWIFPSISIAPGQYLVVFASGKDTIAANNELHTNFSLSKDGEYLAIIEPGGIISDEYAPAYIPQQTDMSFGYYQGQLVFFEIPTPGAINSHETKAQIPQFSVQRGYFVNPFTVSLSVSDSETRIYYTTDGTRPTAQSMLYSGPLSIDKTTPLSAVGIKNEICSHIVTQTYFFIKDIVNQPNNPPGYPDRWGYLGADVKYADYAVGERAPADYALDPGVCESPAYKDLIQKAFISIPTVSIVTNPGYLFSDSTDEDEGGIYIHTGVVLGAEWERPVSIEYFEPATNRQFQINCGLKLHGAASRQPEKTGKHSFRAAFRGIYGAGKLQFDLFENASAVNKFDHLIFRAGYNQSWLHTDSWQRTNSQYTNDSFSKKVQLDMGQPSSHDRFVHLYINGLYWGLYDVSERISDNFMEAYFGGGEADYDIINHDGLSEGYITAYNRMLELAKAGNYDELVSEKLLDMESFIDYMLLNFYIGNMDWATNNWYTARNRINPESGFRFFSWDAESSLTDVNLNRINGGSGFQGKFRSILFGSSSGTTMDGGLYNNKEFRLLFADRVNKHFFRGGSLTPEKTAELYQKVANEIDFAIILESARWGDYRRNTLKPSTTLPPVYTRNDHWLPRKEKLLKDYFPKRTDIVYKQLESLGLVSEIASPVFSTYGGIINSPVTLSMTASIGIVYYTTNGLDPREAGSGNITGWASEYKAPVQINGTYTVKARSKNGLTWSALTEATFTRENGTDITNPEIDLTTVYYRNNSLYFNSTKNGEVILEIYTADGKCVQQTSIYCQAGNNVIGLAIMPGGVYVYKMLSNGSCTTGKFIK